MSPASSSIKTKPVDNQRKTTTIYGAPEGHDVLLLAEKARELANTDKVLVHIAVDDTRLSNLADLFKFFAPDVDVVEFPAWDCLPYDRVSPSNDIVAKRVAALSRLVEWNVEKKRYPRVLVTTINAAIQRVPPKTQFEKAGFSASKGGTINQQDLLSFLSSNGYMRTETVREAGEFAIRGGIIDLFPSGYEKPVRLDLFGDEIDTIKTFDPLSQSTEEKLESFSLRPVTEFFLDEQSISNFRSGYRQAFGTVKAGDPLYEAVSEGRRYNGMDHWLPLFYDGKMDTIFDYIETPITVMDAQVEQARGERHAQIADFYDARKTLEAAVLKRKPTKQNFKRGEGSDVSMSGAVYHPLKMSRLYVMDEEWESLIHAHAPAQILSPFKMPEAANDGDSDGGGKKGRDFVDIRALPDGNVMGELKRHIESINFAARKVMIAAYSEGARDRLKVMLENAGLNHLKIADNFKIVEKLGAFDVALTILPLESGFISDHLAVLTEQDILGDRLARKKSKRKKADNFLTEVSSLDEGDLVVHVDHGVGRFVGLTTLEAAGTYHDCLKILYSGDDKLFVPVENIEVLSRFGSDSETVQLDKLGGAGWQARKAKVKKDLMRIAEHLMKIAAARMLRKGEKLSVDSHQYQEFAARFPYHETEDQLRTIESVIEDLAGEHPMDRLVCGDVGFGKTEVAMRAAYVAALSGVQVAIVVPTTLLARQHYAGFVKRFEGLGIRIGQLSRMVTAKEAAITKKGLVDGSVNIVIGTHALFSNDVKFAHLGLVIVDEEQRFGVKQKEKMKEFKADVHVLTLTATPIPRTLQMSLTGVKEMSLITTPPVDRLAIRTFVLPYDPLVIREALLREHYRGGQSFYVCPRVKDLKDIEDELKELVPELKTVSAHGQMTPTELEDRMSAFYDGQYDILLATQIVESGLDIPTANTMIVHRADMFGLAQLYQIRGRIGRSKMRAYAYLTHDPYKPLTQQGQKRLEVIETLDTLGAGFQLASHDMDIRGAGNLVGEEQSGHIKEVGVELYQQMLEEAVAMAKAGVDINDVNNAPDQWSPQINIGTSVLIPEAYVQDLSIRMSLYRRLADLENEQDIEGFAAELIDRFGPIPNEVENLMDIVKIKRLCKIAGIAKVDAGPKGAVIGFYKDVPPNVEKLMMWLTSKRGAVKLRPDQKIALVRQWDTPSERVNGVKALMKELANL